MSAGTEDPPRHRVAGRLLRLPHVVPRYRRAPDRAGEARRRRLGSAGGREGVPEDVDVTLVEGAISSEEDLHRIRLVRARTKVLVSLGDCAVTGNVPAMRNNFGADAVLRRAYLENATLDPQLPREIVPPLLAARPPGARSRARRRLRPRLPAVGGPDLSRC